MAELTRPVAQKQRGQHDVLAWLARRNHGYYVLGYLVLLILAVWTLFPVYWQLVTSLRSDVDLFSPTVTLIPRVLTADHYEKILGPS